MARSNKTSVIETLFDKRWQGSRKPLSKSIVTLAEVQEAIRAHNRANPRDKLSTRNPANFFKDFIRKRASANQNWPQAVLNKGYTARQVTGKGLCFEFIKLAPGQVDPFPSGAIAPNPQAPVHRIQSASMPIASRRLGRKDEGWLIQVLAKLHMIETHLALESPRPIIQVDLLQTNVKLSGAEIDALFLAIEQDMNDPRSSPKEVLVTCEAKGRADDILIDQIASQVSAAFRMKGVTQDFVLPLAAKAVGPSRIHILQFFPVDRASAGGPLSLQLESEAVYELVPPVPGVGR
jgi:hypothetical protein